MYSILLLILSIYQVSQRKTNHHKDSVTSLGWCMNELLTLSDDKTIVKWNLDGEVISTLATLDTFAIDLHWFPRYQYIYTYFKYKYQYYTQNNSKVTFIFLLL